MTSEVDVAVEVLLVNPCAVTYARWAQDLAEQLSSYNAPNPGPEDSWLQWAAAIQVLPEIAELGVQDPVTFGSWREWGAALLQVLT